ncbi:MAG: TolC family protein [Daejeonella sp.]
MSIFFVLIGMNTYSQTELSLNQAWEKAYQDYPELKEKNALINAAQFNTLKVKSGMLPNSQVQLQNSYGTFEGSGGAFFPLPGIFNVNGNNPDAQVKTTANSFGSVLIDWNIYQFGRLRQSIKAANSLTEQARGEFTLSKLNIQTSVTRLYFNILYSDAYLIWAKDNSERVKKILEIAISLADAGLKPGADTSLASSSYLQALSRTDEWNGKLAGAKMQLSEFIPELRSNISLKSDFYLKTPIGFYRPDSLNKHPVLNVLAQEVIYDQIRQKEISSAILPTVSLLGGASSRGNGIGTSGVNNSLASGFQNVSNNYLVGIGLTWNISDIYSGSLEKRRVAQQTIAAQSRYDLRKIQLNTNVQSIDANIAEQIKQVSKSDSAVQKSKEAYELYFARYESGLINLTELLQIQQLLQEAEKSNIDAHQSLWDQLISRGAATNNFTYLANQF